MHDFVIIGAGIAGTTLAWRLAAEASVQVVEAESQAGYHASGRSAAMFMESYGTPAIRALTRAGRSFFENPPAGLAEHPLLTRRGVLYLAQAHQEDLAQSMVAGQTDRLPVEALTPAQVTGLVPCVRPEGLAGGVFEPGARDIDVHALLHGCLRLARQQGAVFQFGASVQFAHWQHGHWQLHMANGDTLRARVVINAAGAWAQQVADRFGAIQTGLQPRRRSAFTFAPQYTDGTVLAREAYAHWPTVAGIDESFYFKPDGGQLLGSPANADAVVPHDVVAEEFDIALGMDRIMSATRLAIRRPAHTWAGLRSFVPDGDFVIGHDPRAANFFWLAGQGGYGIQTAPGASLLAAGMLLEQSLDPELAAQGVTPDQVSPHRFANL